MRKMRLLARERRRLRVKTMRQRRQRLREERLKRRLRRRQVNDLYFVTLPNPLGHVWSHLEEQLPFVPLEQRQSTFQSWNETYGVFELAEWMLEGTWKRFEWARNEWADYYVFMLTDSIEDCACKCRAELWEDICQEIDPCDVLQSPDGSIVGFFSAVAGRYEPVKRRELKLQEKSYHDEVVAGARQTVADLGGHYPSDSEREIVWREVDALSASGF